MGFVPKTRSVGSIAKVARNMLGHPPEFHADDLVRVFAVKIADAKTVKYKVTKVNSEHDFVWLSSKDLLSVKGG